MISVEELTNAAISYSVGQLSFDQARAIARRALREAEAAMEVIAFDRIRALAQTPGGIHDVSQKIG